MGMPLELLTSAMSFFAQAAAEIPASLYIPIGAGLGAGLAAIAVSIGIGKIAAGLVLGVAGFCCCDRLAMAAAAQQ